MGDQHRGWRGIPPPAMRRWVRSGRVRASLVVVLDLGGGGRAGVGHVVAAGQFVGDVELVDRVDGAGQRGLGELPDAEDVVQDGRAAATQLYGEPDPVLPVVCDLVLDRGRPVVGSGNGPGDPVAGDEDDGLVLLVRADRVVSPVGVPEVGDAGVVTGDGQDGGHPLLAVVVGDLVKAVGPRLGSGAGQALSAVQGAGELGPGLAVVVVHTEGPIGV